MTKALPLEWQGFVVKRIVAAQGRFQFTAREKVSEKDIFGKSRKQIRTFVPNN